MQALKIDHHGPVSALQVSDVPRPAVGPNQVLVAIEAAAINPSDIASAEGRFDQARLPRILGHDPAAAHCGTVSAVTGS
jgi:NADPH:quinone reductase-like Zn-dependent oxidoreductase